MSMEDCRFMFAWRAGGGSGGSIRCGVGEMNSETLQGKLLSNDNILYLYCGGS